MHARTFMIIAVLTFILAAPGAGALQFTPKSESGATNSARDEPASKSWSGGEIAF